MNILTINTGSSSVRLALFEHNKKGLNRTGEIHLKSSKGSPGNHLRHFLHEQRNKIDIAAHRIVHGGPTFTKTSRITKEVEREIERLVPLAPLHNPVSLKWISAFRTNIDPDIPQVAVFDTAFYANMPDVSKLYALPGDICREHCIRRYGFHGIAHKAMLHRLKRLHPNAANQGKVISIQLGSGCSITAIKDGRPLDTSMGFSPNEGLVMSTRSGDIDSGVIVYLQNKAGLSASDIDNILNKSSGLLGVSGLSGDMKTLLESKTADAKLAIRLYCYRVKKYIGSYMAVLGGVDCILFGGGVGENAPAIREQILENMTWCGISLDRHSNDETTGKEGRITSDKSKVDVLVIPVDEAEVLAKEAVNVIDPT